MSITDADRAAVYRELADEFESRRKYGTFAIEPRWFREKANELESPREQPDWKSVADSCDALLRAVMEAMGCPVDHDPVIWARKMRSRQAYELDSPQATHVDLLATTDAAKWTDAFLSDFTVTRKAGVEPGTDEEEEAWQWGLMVGWFANAIETGRSKGSLVEDSRQDEWERSLPIIKASTDHFSNALHQLRLALMYERDGLAGDMLENSQDAAANIVAWRKALPESKLYDPAIVDLFRTHDDRRLMRDAIVSLLIADEGRTDRGAEPAGQLRGAEIRLRLLWQRHQSTWRDEDMGS